MFSELWKKYDFNAVTARINSAARGEVLTALSKDNVGIDDLPVLFSEAAAEFLEEMAARASQITKERFGNVIQLYAPLYLSNECANGCLYCGFSRNNKAVTRRTLTPGETEAELKAVEAMGIRHILLVCGEAPAKVSMEYLADTLRLAREYASFRGIEIYPLSEDGYRTLVDAGADGLTVYQETYNPARYAEVHPSGRKKDIAWRLDAPDRGGRAGMRTLGVGALLGLDDPRTDAYFAAMHAAYLTKTYWRSQITISFPRMRPAEGRAVTPRPVSDALFVQFIVAARLALPDAGIVVSTRENAALRDNLAGLGVTQMSAASATEPGGYTSKNVSTAQFQVEDGRSVAEFAAMLERKGFTPVMKDWDGEL